MRGRITLIAVLFLESLSFGQEYTNEYIENINTIISSPNVSDMWKYNDLPVDYFSGTINLSIPIFNIAVDNLNIPINITYSSEGVKVSKIASWVGMGWNLNAGGVVTREVRNVPDEKLRGYLYRKNIVHDLSTRTTNINDLYEISKIARSWDGEPDIFHFQCGNYKGSFCFNEQGTITLIPKQPIKIEYTIVNQTGFHSITGFSLTTPEGIKYNFDEAIISYSQYYQYCSQDYQRQCSHDLQCPLDCNGNAIDYFVGPYNWYFLSPPIYPDDRTATSWLLSSIVLLNKDRINFSYSNQNIDSRFVLGERIQFWNYPCNSEVTKERMLNVARTVILDKTINNISWAGGSIEFIPQLENRLDLIGEDQNQDYAHALDSIKIYNNANELIKSHKFYYDYVISDGINDYPDHREPTGSYIHGHTYYKRLFLSKLSVFDKNNENEMPPFKFYYNNKYKLPNRLSPQQDYWGFYNGNGANSLIPKLWEYRTDYVKNNQYQSSFSIFQRSSYSGSEIYHSSYVNVPAFNRQPDQEKVLSGSLAKIIYPTGGYDTLIYEPNEFYIDNKNVKGPGIRIKTIKTYDPLSGKYLTKDYFYFDPQYPTRSSGIILSLPQFAEAQGTNTTDNSHFCNNGDCRNYPVIYGMSLSESDKVRYRTVSEVLEGKGKNVFYFRLPIDCTSETDSCITQENCVYKRTQSEFLLGNCRWITEEKVDEFPFANNPNYDWNMGQLLTKSIYDINNNKLKQINYKYTFSEVEKVYGIKSRLKRPPLYHPVGHFNCDFKMGKYYNLSTWIVLKSIDSITIGGSNNLSKLSEFKYDNSTHRQVTRIIESTSDNYKMERIIQYPDDYTDVSGFLGLMKTNHIISKPIESVSLITDITGANEKIIHGNVFYYKTGNKNLGLLDQVWKLENDMPIAKANFKFSNKLLGNVPPGGVNQALNKDSNYTLDICFDHFDNNRNILQYHANNDIANSFIWGYKDSIFLVSKIVGADYNTAYSILNSSDKTILTGNPTDDQVRSIIAKIRNSSAMINAMVYTYTYNAFGKISSETDEHNIITYYEYDNSGRLTNVKDHYGNILKHYEYHYRE